jgi:hypothetical protein
MALSTPDTQHEQQSALQCFASCFIVFSVMLNAIMLSVVILNVIMLSVVMLNVVVLDKEAKILAVAAISDHFT